MMRKMWVYPSMDYFFECSNKSDELQMSQVSISSVYLTESQFIRMQYPELAKVCSKPYRFFLEIPGKKLGKYEVAAVNLSNAEKNSFKEYLVPVEIWASSD